jgi:hypothetical protein
MLRQILGHLGGEQDSAAPQGGSQTNADAEAPHNFGESPPAGAGSDRDR